MSLLKRLQVNHLRNLKQVNLELSPKINLFYGENGSGKTSLLEAVSLLGLGRSFRSHKSKTLVNLAQTELTIFAELFSTHIKSSVGITKGRRGETTIRINGENAKSAVSLAQQLPLQLINSDSFLLIEGSPVQRRQFLDWMVFHVKPEFIHLWKKLQRVISQRNKLLKHDRISQSEISPWDKEFIKLSIAVDQLRKDVFDQYLELFSLFSEQQENIIFGCEQRYYPGWDRDKEFEEVLIADFERDSRDGYTHHGPQRADIKFSVEGTLASDILSRGQKKLLICALQIVQATLYEQARTQSCVFLIDDLLSELDKTHANLLITWLSELNSQVLITGIDENELLSIIPELELSPKMFHVKHGDVIPKV